MSLAVDLRKFSENLGA